MLAFVWAEDQHHLIGKQGTLPWHLPNDLQFFKKTTLHQTIVMGRKTFEGMQKRLLPQRQTIVLTSDAHYDGAGAQVCNSVADIVQRAQNEAIYVIGGSQIFAAFLPYVTDLYVTRIAETFAGDAYMPTIDYTQFTCVWQEEGVVDEANRYAHTFYHYQKRVD